MKPTVRAPTGDPELQGTPLHAGIDNQCLGRGGRFSPGRPAGEKSWSNWGAVAISVGVCSVTAWWPHSTALLAGSAVVLNRRLLRRSRPSSVLTLPVSLPPKLRVTTAETEQMPFYLRTFFRVLSSWVHGEKSGSRRGVIYFSPFLSVLSSRRRGDVRSCLHLFRDPRSATAPPRWIGALEVGAKPPATTSIRREPTRASTTNHLDRRQV